MSENELKVGQSATFKIAGRDLRLKPLSLGKMKRATMIFSEKDADIELIGKYIFAILDNGENPKITLQWVQDNVTIPEAQEMIDASRKINGLGNFFQKGPTATNGVKEVRPLEETMPTPSV